MTSLYGSTIGVAFLALLLSAMLLIASYLVVDERRRRSRVWAALGGRRTVVARQFEAARRHVADPAPVPVRRIMSSDVLEGIGRLSLLVPFTALVATYPFFTFVEWLLAIYPLVLCAWWMSLRRDRVRNAAVLPSVAWVAACGAWFAAMPWWDRDELDGWWYGPLTEWWLLMPVVGASMVVGGIAVAREVRADALGNWTAGALGIAAVASSVLVWSCLGQGLVYMMVAVLAVGFAMSRVARLADDRRRTSSEAVALELGQSGGTEGRAESKSKRMPWLDARVGAASVLDRWGAFGVSVLFLPLIVVALTLADDVVQDVGEDSRMVVAWVCVAVGLACVGVVYWRRFGATVALDATESAVAELMSVATGRDARGRESHPKTTTPAGLEASGTSTRS